MARGRAHLRHASAIAHAGDPFRHALTLILEHNARRRDVGGRRLHCRLWRAVRSSLLRVRLQHLAAQHLTQPVSGSLQAHCGVAAQRASIAALSGAAGLKVRRSAWINCMQAARSMGLYWAGRHRVGAGPQHAPINISSGVVLARALLCRDRAPGPLLIGRHQSPGMPPGGLKVASLFSGAGGLDLGLHQVRAATRVRVPGTA